MKSRYLRGSVWHSLPAKEGISFVYEGSDTFTVVRNPYDRVLSAYYYDNRHEQNDYFNRSTLNDYILNRIKPNWTARPQSTYTHDENGHKIIDRVIRFERLDVDFPRLMKRYNLNVALPSRPLNVRRSKAKMGVKHMSKKALQFLNDF